MTSEDRPLEVAILMANYAMRIVAGIYNAEIQGLDTGLSSSELKEQMAVQRGLAEHLECLLRPKE